jgi:hypothetical protein
MRGVLHRACIVSRATGRGQSRETDSPRRPDAVHTGVWRVHALLGYLGG